MCIIKYDYSKLMSLSRRLKDDGCTIITLNGCFDLVHPGHMKILRFSHSQKIWNAPALLFVGLNSDESVRRNKGGGRPILTEDERSEFLLSTGYVDYVFVYNEDTSEEFVNAMSPSFHINDDSYGLDCVEKKILDRIGGKLILFPKEENKISTTDIINRIVNKNDSRAN